MINVMSYVGMSLHSEVCLWTLIGLVRTIFDATLFKVNANLKQVWQMTMPEELSLPVQRGLRTMISGVMLVQCFTVYVYLATYIVVLYPIFLEERPTLVLPWLLLAAIRSMLCELTSLALGLGTCVLLGPARTPCIKFVIIKIISIMPSFYMWMLIYSYYHALKVASLFQTFPADLPPSDHDYGLELAIRRRRAKSLLGEDQLRKRLISNYYDDNHPICDDIGLTKTDYSTRMNHATDTNVEDDINIIQPICTVSNRAISETPIWFEELLGCEVVVPRGTDRILEQFIVMMLRISAYLSKEGNESYIESTLLRSCSVGSDIKRDPVECTAMAPESTETPPLVGSSNAKTASYLRDYPHIFMKKSEIPLSLGRDSNIRTQHTKFQDDSNTDAMCRKWSNSVLSEKSLPTDLAASSFSKKTAEAHQHKSSHLKSNEKNVSFTPTEKILYLEKDDIEDQNINKDRYSNANTEEKQSQTIEKSDSSLNANNEEGENNNSALTETAAQTSYSDQENIENGTDRPSSSHHKNNKTNSDKDKKY